MDNQVQPILHVSKNILENIFSKNIWKKTPESSKKQNLNLPHAGNYLHSIYIILGIICNLELPDVQAGIRKGRGT